MAARLKVFVTSDGLTDYIVAATSRPKALAAWGVRQDVFKEGAAHETDDPALVKAATAEPGVVLRRPAGSRKTLAKLKVLKPKPAPKPKPVGPSPAQIRKVEMLERRLEKLVADQAEARRKLEDDLSAARRALG